MTIEGSKPPERTDIYDVKAQKTDKNQATEKATSTEKQPGPSDRVNLSEQSKEISRLKTMMNQLPDVRADEVESLKKAVETNTYSPDSLKVAEKILKEM